MSKPTSIYVRYTAPREDGKAVVSTIAIPERTGNEGFAALDLAAKHLGTGVDPERELRWLNLQRRIKAEQAR